VLLEIVNSVAEQERRGVSVGRRFLTDVIIINPYITPDPARIHAALRRSAEISRSGTSHRNFKQFIEERSGRRYDLWHRSLD